MQEFTDAAGKYTGIIINVTNAQGAQKIQIVLGVNDPSGSQVAWSSGPSFATAAGMQLSPTTGALPLSQFNITGSTITFMTASGGSGALGFTFQLYLVAASDLKSFTLTANTDPNVLITAGPFGSVPQTIGTNTILNWPTS